MNQAAASVGPSNMIEDLNPPDMHDEQISLPTQNVILELVKRSQDDEQRPDHVAAQDTENPVYVTGWRLRLLTIGSV